MHAIGLRHTLDADGAAIGGPALAGDTSASGRSGRGRSERGRHGPGAHTGADLALSRSGVVA